MDARASAHTALCCKLLITETQSTDACTLAAVAALRDLRLPQLSEVGDDDDALPAVVEERAVALTVAGPPVPVSFAMCSGEVRAHLPFLFQMILTRRRCECARDVVT